MSFDVRKKESEEIYKTKKADKWFYFIGIALLIFSVFFVATEEKGDLSDLFFSPVWYDAKHYPYLFYTEIVLIIGIAVFWYGFSFPVFYFRNKKIRFYVKNFYKGEKRELDDIFYQSPKQTDELPRAKNVIFTKITPKDFFKDDYENIINLFRCQKCFELEKKYKNKRKFEKELNRIDVFKEKEKTFNGLIEIIEGVFKEYTKGQSKIYIKDSIPNPFTAENIRDASVFDLKEGKVYISPKQLLEVFDGFCERFEKFLNVNAKYKTRIYKLYSNQLKDEKKRKQMLVYFKLVMFRKLLKLYMNIPAGWLVIRLEDYTVRAIISVIDRKSIVIIDSRNRGDIKGFPDDRDTRMFLILYHYFFLKTDGAKMYKHIFEFLTPDKTAKEIENYILANRNELENFITGG